MPEGINFLVYGPEKQGKTTFSASGPKPLLAIDVEGRFWITTPADRRRTWDPVKEAPPPDDGSWDVAIVNAKSFAVIERALQWLESGKHPFRSVVLDSVSEAQQLAIAQIAGVNAMQTQDWGTVLRLMLDVCRRMRGLSSHPVHPMDAVVVVATMAKVKQDGATPGQTVQIHTPDAQGQLRERLPFIFDLCGYYYCTDLRNDGPRRLITAPVDGFRTGSAYPSIPKALDNPTVADMVVRARGTQPEAAAQ